MERKESITMKKPTKEQMKYLLLIIAVICLFKIAFFGITIDTNEWGISVSSDVSGHIEIDQ